VLVARGSADRAIFANISVSHSDILRLQLAFPSFSYLISGSLHRSAYAVAEQQVVLTPSFFSQLRFDDAKSLSLYTVTHNIALVSCTSRNKNKSDISP